MTILLVTGASGGIGAYTWLQSAALAEELADDVFEAHFGRVVAVAESHLRMTTHLLETNRRLIARGAVDDRDGLGTYLVDVLRAWPQYAVAGWGDRDGEAFWARRRADGAVVVDDYARGPEGTVSYRELAPTQDGRLAPTGQPEPVRFDPRTRPWYLVSRDADGPHWTSPYLFLPQEHLGITCSTRVLGPDGAVRGVTTLDFELTFLSQTLASMEAASIGQLAIVTRDGTLIAHSRADLAVAHRDGKPAVATAGGSADPVLRGAWEGLPLDATGQLATTRSVARDLSIAGELHRVVARPLGSAAGLGWHFLLIVPEEAILATVHEHQAVVLLIVLLALLLAVLAAWLFAQRITVGLEALTGELDRINRFDFSERPPLTSRIVEIAKLDRSVGRLKGGLRSFEKYVHADIVRTLLASGVEARLGGERRRLTLFFADLADFTSLAEGLAPEAIAAFLGEWLGRATDAISAHGGTVDKYIGDAVMAFWGAPREVDDHALRACRAALALREAARDTVRPDGAPLRVRVGLHTGDALVGNLGSPARFDYTAIGDAVNVASRLEGANRFYGTCLLLSEVTRDAVGDAIVVRPIDRVAVKGRREGLRVYELLGLAGEVSEARVAQAAAHAEAFASYASGRFAEAAAAFDALLEVDPDDRAVRVLAQRTALYAHVGPPDDWTGVFEMLGK